MISVLIPTGSSEKPQWIYNTVESVTQTAKEDIEVLVLLDGWENRNKIVEIRQLLKPFKNVRILPSSDNKGERGTVNRGAAAARGKFIIKLDAHCSLSAGWDVALKEQCCEKYLLVCTLDALNAETWIPLGHRYERVYITPSGEEKWWPNHLDHLDAASTIVPSMSLTGCGWFCRRDYFLEHLRYDETLGKWGCIGPEMSAKVEKSGGAIFIHRGVRCGHVFSTNPRGYPVSEVVRTRKAVLSKYSAAIWALAQRFSNIPGWKHVLDDYPTNWEAYFMYETTIDRKETTETRDSSGNVIKKVIKYYQPVPYKGAENPDDPEVGKRLTQDAPVVQIRIADWGVQGWHYTTLNKKEDIELWLFENAPV